MTTVATLVAQFNNHLRYLITESGAGGTCTIPSAGGVTPDLVTDSLPGPIRAISQAQQTGLGIIAAGALTQAQARALWLSDNTGGSVGNANTPRTICTITPRAGLTVWLLDANQSSGNPVIAVTASAVAGTAYLDIEAVGSIGA